MPPHVAADRTVGDMMLASVDRQRRCRAAVQRDKDAASRVRRKIHAGAVAADNLRHVAVFEVVDGIDELRIGEETIACRRQFGCRERDAIAAVGVVAQVSAVTGERYANATCREVDRRRRHVHDVGIMDVLIVPRRNRNAGTGEVSPIAGQLRADDPGAFTNGDHRPVESLGPPGKRRIRREPGAPFERHTGRDIDRCRDRVQAKICRLLAAES